MDTLYPVLLTSEQILLTLAFLRVHRNQFRKDGFEHPDLKELDNTITIMETSVGLEKENG